jgi:outer membrane biosynthesis protein TonB
MRTAYIISGVGHAVVIVWSVLSLAARPLPVALGEGVPVDIVSVSEFTQMTAGNKNAPKTETAKPLVEQVGEAKPADDVTANIDKKEVKAARESAPAPEVKPAEVKPDKKPAETKPDPIAEALAREEVKKPEPKKAEAKPPTPPKKPAPPAPKFDPSRVEALLNKQEPKRVAAVGDAINSEPTIGVSDGKAKALSISELDALRQRLAQLWSPPAGAKSPQELVSVFRIRLKPDGTIAPGYPQLVSSGNSQIAMAARESAARAINRGQPYDMLKPENYELWKDIEITFDPRDMLPGY